MNLKYILDESGNPKPIDDVLEWAKWMEQPGCRRIAKTDIDEFYVSTVFLGIDHGWHGGPPVLFETMVFEAKEESAELFTSFFKFNPSKEEYTRRYSTVEDAKRGHEDVCEQFRNRLRLVKK